MNKTEIVTRLAAHMGTSKAEAKRLLDAHIEAMAHHLAIGNRVVMRGIGSFWTHEVPGHRGRRPTDGKTLEIPPKRQVSFRASDQLRADVQAREPPA